MKSIVKKIFGFLFLFSVSVSLELKAEEVRVNDVRKVAVNAFSNFSGKIQNELKIVQEIPVSHFDTTAFYVVNFENGFIIIAADNIAEPILGFSLTSSFDFNDMPPALSDLLEGYKQEIVYAKRLNYRTSQAISDKWNDYLDSNRTSVNNSGNSRAGANIYMEGTWLVKTKWNQDGGNAAGSSITYNYYCPLDPADPLGWSKTIVGCGGVALAQILYYWSCSVHPQNIIIHNQQGFPSININLSNQTYNWNAMLPSQATLDNALLLYHCATALKSIFGTAATGGTSSRPSDIPDVLKNNFGVTGDFHYKFYNQQTWIDLLKDNINNRRPVFYSGQKTTGAGHGWVVDGYLGNLFHCNFGWGGSSDGWYNLSNLTGNITYNSGQNAIVNIYPTYYSYPSILLHSTTINTSTHTGHTIRVENCNIQNNANVILKADCTVEILGTFSAPLGTTLKIQ